MFVRKSRYDEAVARCLEWKEIADGFDEQIGKLLDANHKLAEALVYRVKALTDTVGEHEPMKTIAQADVVSVTAARTTQTRSRKND